MDNGLDKKLSALTGAVEFEDGKMVLGEAGSASRVTEILNAIDNTVLPRSMEFSVGGSSVSLNVSGRRLRSCSAASDDLNLPQELLGKTLSADDENALHAIGEALKRLTAGDGTLMVVRNPEPTSSGQSDAGVGVRAMARHWGLDLNARAPTALDKFVASLGSEFIASIEIEGESATNSQGNARIAAALESVALENVTVIAQKLAALNSSGLTTHMVFLEGMLADDVLVGLISLADTRALVAVSPNAYADIAVAWSQV